MKCTIQNIADHLGLSRNTVSKALKNSSEVSENTRNLVIKTASKLGYKNATFATPVIPASENRQQWDDSFPYQNLRFRLRILDHRFTRN